MAGRRNRRLGFIITLSESGFNINEIFDIASYMNKEINSKVPEAQDSNGVPETVNPETPEISESAPANIDNASASDYSTPDVVIINPIVTEALII